MPRQRDCYNCGLYTITNIDRFCSTIQGEVTLQEPRGRSNARAILADAPDPYFIESPKAWGTPGDIGFLRILLSAGMSERWQAESTQGGQPEQLSCHESRELLRYYLEDRTPKEGIVWCDYFTICTLLAACTP